MKLLERIIAALDTLAATNDEMLNKAEQTAEELNAFDRGYIRGKAAGYRRAARLVEMERYQHGDQP